jgi:ribosomal 50S subunit-associated protein YjgA (DUF615 family)
VAADKKRRRIEAAASSGAVQRSARESTCSAMSANPIAAASKMLRVASTKTVQVVLSGSKRKVDSLASTRSMDVEVAAEDESELKRLRQEVSELREANEQLVYAQMTRETEIRMEVSQEMAKRSQHLLEQIQTLQRQLSEQTNSSIGDITRSVKKERKRQMKTIAEEMSGRDMQEVEDELERVKATYEAEIAVLKSQNKALANAVEKLQGPGGPAGIMPPSSVAKVVTISSAIASVVSTSSSSLQQSLDASSAQVAAEYSKRFGKKSDENAVPVNIAPVVCGVEKTSPMNKSPLSHSPSRSPLSEVRNAGNSPVLKSYQNGTVSAAAKRVDSPQRMRDENSAVSASSATYGTRLRSQQIRA